jgi:hypothetical protein
VEKYGWAWEATDDIIRRIHFQCWITKATATHSEYVIIVIVVICTFLVLLSVLFNLAVCY